MESKSPEHNPHQAPHSGTFAGHIVPSIFFIVMGSLWTYNALFRYYVARRRAVLKRNNKLCYKNSLFSKYHSGWAHVAPVEAASLILIVVPDCIAEIVGALIGYPATMAMQHILMYSFYGLMGATSILQHYKYAVPPSSDYAAFITANGVTSFLLSNHLSGREIINRQMHMMLAYFHIIAAVCTAVEMIYERSVTAALGRTLVFTAQGVWMCMMAVIIHPLPFMHTWDLNDHKLLAVVSSLGIVALVTAVIVAVVMNIIISTRVRNMSLATMNRIVALTHDRCVPSGSKAEAESPLISNSDDEV